MVTLGYPGKRLSGMRQLMLKNVSHWMIWPYQTRADWFQMIADHLLSCWLHVLAPVPGRDMVQKA